MNQSFLDVLAPDSAAVYREQMRQKGERDLELMELVRHDCIEALEHIAGAMRHPRISQDDLEEAIRLLSTALKSSKELDR